MYALRFYFGFAYFHSYGFYHIWSTMIIYSVVWYSIQWDNMKRDTVERIKGPFTRLLVLYKSNRLSMIFTYDFRSSPFFSITVWNEEILWLRTQSHFFNWTFKTFKCSSFEFQTDSFFSTISVPLFEWNEYLFLLFFFIRKMLAL